MKQSIVSHLFEIGLSAVCAAVVVEEIVSQGWGYAAKDIAPFVAAAIAYALLAGPVPWRPYVSETRIGSTVLVAALICAFLSAYLAFNSFHDLYHHLVPFLLMVLFGAIFGARWDLLGPKRQVRLPGDPR